jgi:Domain of unknown function (DUF6443)
MEQSLIFNITATMKKIIIIPIFLSIGFLKTLAQTPAAGKNAIMEKTPREAMTTVAGATHTTVQTAIRYFDGLARPTQTVLYRASPDATKDIVASSTEYDGFGNPYKNTLPTPSDVATGAYSTTVQTLAESFYNDTHPYQQSVFEQSPLNRAVETFGAGQAWRVLNNEKSTKIAYGAAGNEILEFRMNATGGVDVLGAYGGSSLYVQTITSERGFRTNEYKDRLGRVVAKSQELTKDVFAVTGFIYDDLNRLRIVVQPEAYKTVSTLPSFTLGSTVCKEGMFFYLYDSRGRVAEKRVPGGGTVRYVYDRNDRVVLENDDRDANIPLPGTNYYKFTKYDILGRPVMQGLINNIGGFSRSQLQQDFDDFADVSTNVIYEERGADLMGYTNRSFPANYTPQISNLRMITYYDDYLWNTDVSFNFDVANAFHSQGLSKGLVTGKLKRNLRTGTWQKVLLYYDYQGRVIQDWHLTNRGNLIRKDLQYHFNGELLKTRIVKKNGSTVLSIKIITYEYDHISRKVKYKYLLNGNERTLAKYEYDDIGRMKLKAYSPSTPTGSKQTGAWLDNATWLTGSYPTLSDQVTINAGHTVTIPSGNFASAGMLNDNGILQNNGTLNLGNVNPSTTTLQPLSYSYHIRGGLKGINLDASGNLTNSLFSYRLDYENGTNGYFDGNISKQSWQSNIDGKERDFTYIYDGASRLKSGAYNSTLAGENYALNNVSYDDNGNITNLSRNGLKSDNTFGLIDNLNYTYNTNANKILKVDDASTETASFRDVVGNDYTYWQDGSLRSDNNKDITNISYNYLKLPEEITLSGGRWIRYDYDADGIKLKKTLSTGKYTDYEEDDIYEDGILYQTSNDEGRIVNDVYEYDIKDHLGNTRVSFRDNNGNAQITQVNHGGAFGESLESLSYVNTPKINNFTVSTYEKENDFGINVFDAHARVFDPVVPRMWQQDRVSESFAHLSLYNFNANNPIVNVDASGDSTSYFNTYGELLYTSFDQLENAITVIPEDNIEEFMKALNSYIERQRTSQYKKNKKNEDNRINAVLRGYYGTSYMIDGFKKFFNLNKNDTKWNRQFGQKTHLEHGSFLYKSNNTIRIGNENISGGLGAVIFGDTPENAVGRLHTHDDLNIYEEHPSEYDRNYHSSSAGTYNVVIGPQNIYFYSNQPKLMNFNIPKNNTFKK